MTSSLQHSPLRDMERIFALADRAAREAALLTLEQNRRDMVSHFLVLRLAKSYCEAVPRGAVDQVIAHTPAHLVDDMLSLGRSYIEAAKVCRTTSRK